MFHTPDTLNAGDLEDLRAYLATLGDAPLLTAGEEKALARLNLSGDQDALTKLIERNLRLVVAIARRWTGNGVELIDLVQSGNIGLMRAAQKFDPERGTRFSTFAKFHIRKAIKRCIIDQSSMIRVPRDVYEEIETMQRAEARLLARFDRLPAPDELARELGCTVDQVNEWTHARSRLTAGLRPTVSDDEPISRIQALGPQPSTLAEHDEMRRLTDSALADLDDVTRRIMALRFGLDGEREHDLTEIGPMVGMSAQAAGKRVKNALARLASSSAHLSMLLD